MTNMENEANDSLEDLSIYAQRLEALLRGYSSKRATAIGAALLDKCGLDSEDPKDWALKVANSFAFTNTLELSAREQANNRVVVLERRVGDQAPYINAVQFYNCVVIESRRSLVGSGQGRDPYRIVECNFHDCIFVGDFSSVLFSGCKFLGTTWVSARHHRTAFAACVLTNIRFVDTVLSGTRFANGTAFKGTSSFLGLTIDRYSLEMLGADYGGLSVAARMDMTIRDGSAMIRRDYTGYLQWVHMLALAVFLAPYVFFMASRLLEAWWRSTPCEEPGFVVTALHAGAASTAQSTAVACISAIESGHMPLWKALMNFAVSGGDAQAFRFEWVSLVAAYSLIYNGVRASLLYKAKQLELEELVSGLPSNQNARGGWIVVLKAARAMFYANLVLLVWHTLHFMSQLVPP